MYIQIADMYPGDVLEIQLSLTTTLSITLKKYEDVDTKIYNTVDDWDRSTTTSSSSTSSSESSIKKAKLPAAKGTAETTQTNNTNNNNNNNNNTNTNTNTTATATDADEEFFPRFPQLGLSSTPAVTPKNQILLKDLILYMVHVSSITLHSPHLTLTIHPPIHASTRNVL